MKEHNKKRLLGVVLGVLCVAIVGLVIGIVVVNVNNRSVGGLSMEEQLNSVGVRDIEARVAIYQEFIDKAEGEELLELLDDRIDYIVNVDTTFSYGGVVINDAIAVDGILQSVESAVSVANIALSYDDYETYMKYISIVAERQGVTGEENINGLG